MHKILSYLFIHYIDNVFLLLFLKIILISCGDGMGWHETECLKNAFKHEGWLHSILFMQMMHIYSVCNTITLVCLKPQPCFEYF